MGRRAAIFGLAVLFALAFNGAAKAEGLLQPASGPLNLLDPLGDVHTSESAVRTRTVYANLDLLRQLTSQPRGDRNVTLNLFDDTVLEVVTTSIGGCERGICRWRGVVGAEFIGEVQISASEASMFGTVRIDHQVFEIKALGNGVSRITEIDVARLPEEEEPIEVYSEPWQRATAADLGQVANNVATGWTKIKVLLLLPTTQADPALCRSTPTRDIAEDSYEANLNGVWAPAGVFSKVAIRCIDYSPTADLGQDLTWLKNDPDVARKRDNRNADLVSLWVEDGGGNCGLGLYTDALSPATAHIAFNVVMESCAINKYSWAHELGHNLGMQHDRTAEAPDDDPTKCNYGHVIRDIDTGDIFARSVMAYKTLCNQEGASCPRRGDYSRGAVVSDTAHMGWAGVSCSNGGMGDGGAANNKKTLVNNAPIVNLYR